MKKSNHILGLGSPKEGVILYAGRKVWSLAIGLTLHLSGMGHTVDLRSIDKYPNVHVQ